MRSQRRPHAVQRCLYLAGRKTVSRVAPPQFLTCAPDAPQLHTTVTLVLFLPYDAFVRHGTGTPNAASRSPTSFDCMKCLRSSAGTSASDELSSLKAKVFGANSVGAKLFGAVSIGASSLVAKSFGAVSIGARSSGARRSGARPSGARPSGADSLGASPSSRMS